MSEMQAQFEAASEDISTESQAVGDGINQCIDKFNGTEFSCWDSGTQGDIDRALADLQETWNSFASTLLQLASPGNPFWFLDAKDSWLDVVSNVTMYRTYLTSMKGSKLPAATSWSTPDGRTYRDMPDAQTGALDAIKGHADTFATTLNTHGLSLISFWIDIGMAFVDYGQQIAEAVSSFLSMDPLKWLSIVQTIIEAVNGLVDRVQEIIQLITQRWLDTKQLIFDLEKNLADMSGTVGGTWPTVGP